MKCVDINSKEYKELAGIIGNEYAYLSMYFNNSFPLDKAPNGKRSLLFDSIYNKVRDRAKALELKSYAYSSNFIKTFGNWLERKIDNTDRNGEPILEYTHIYSMITGETDTTTTVSELAAELGYYGFNSDQMPDIDIVYSREYLRPVLRDNTLFVHPLVDKYGLFAALVRLFTTVDEDDIELVKQDVFEQIPDLDVLIDDKRLVKIIKGRDTLFQAFSGFESVQAVRDNIVKRFGLPKNFDLNRPILKDHIGEDIIISYKKKYENTGLKFKFDRGLPVANNLKDLLKDTTLKIKKPLLGEAFSSTDPMSREETINSKYANKPVSGSLSGYVAVRPVGIQDEDGNIHFAPAQDEDVSSYIVNPLSRWTAYLKRRQSDLQGQIGQLRNILYIERKKRTKDTKYITELNRQIALLQEDYRALQDIIDRLIKFKTNFKSENAINELNDIALVILIEEIERVENLIERAAEGDAAAIEQAEAIIKFYENAADIRVGSYNPLIREDEKASLKTILDKINNKEEITDSQRVLLHLYTQLKTIAEEFVKYRNDIEAIKKITVKKAISKNPMVKEGNFSFEKMFDPHPDISWFDQFMLNISATLSGEDSAIAQAMRAEARLQFERERGTVAEILMKMDNLQRKVEKKLKKTGVFPLVYFDYTIFAQRDKFGNPTGKLISKFSDVWYGHIRYYLSTKQWKRKLDKATWIRKNTNVVDITRIPSIAEKYKDDERLKKIGELLFGDSNSIVKLFNPDSKYEDELRKTYGKFTDELIEEAEGKLELFIDRIETMITDNMDEADKKEVLLVYYVYSPFSFIDGYFSNKPNDLLVASKARNKVYVVSTQYVTIMPKKEDEQYFDREFDRIEEDEDLYEYWKTLSDASLYINESLSDDDHRLPFNSIPAMKKTLAELFLQYGQGRGFLAKAGAIMRYVSDQFISSIRTQFDKSVEAEKKEGINKRVEMSMYEHINNAIKVRLAEWKTISQLFKVKSSEMTQEQINFISKITGLPATRQAIEKQFGAEMNVKDIIYSFTRADIIQQYSMDIPKIFRASLILAAEYAARRKMLPVIKLMLKMYEEIPDTEKTEGKEKSVADYVDKLSGKDKVKNIRKRAVKRIRNWYDRVVRGYYDSDVYGVFKGIKRPEYNEKEQMSWFTRFLMTGKLYTSEEKNTIRDIEDTMFKLLNQLGQISDDVRLIADNLTSTLKKGYSIRNSSLQHLIKSYNGKNKSEVKRIAVELSQLDKIRSDLGGNFALSSLVKAILHFNIFKSLAYNIMSGINNRIDGYIASLIADATGHYWTPGNISYANLFFTKAFYRWIKPNSDMAKQYKIFEMLMHNYRILQDASDQMQRASVRSSIKNMHKLSPYYIPITRVEMKNQGSIMLAIMMDMTIKDENGNEHPLFDKETLQFTAFEIDDTTGEVKLKDKFNTPENRENWIFLRGDKYNVFKNKVIDANTKIYADFDELGGVMIKSKDWGRALFMFKSWIPPKIYRRFAKYQYTLEHGQIKGIYRSFTPVTATINGALAGFMFGPVWALAGGTLGLLWAMNAGIRSETTALRELLTYSLEVIKGTIFIPLKMIGVVNKTEKINIKGISDVDARNLAANAAEAAMLLGLILLKLAIKFLSWDDDDDDSDYKYYLLFENMITNQIENLSMFTNPVVFYDNTKRITFASTIATTIKILDDIEKAFEGDLYYQSGINKGKLRLSVDIDRLATPTFIKIGGLTNYMKKDFSEKDYLDKLMKSD